MIRPILRVRIDIPAVEGSLIPLIPIGTQIVVTPQGVNRQYSI